MTTTHLFSVYQGRRYSFCQFLTMRILLALSFLGALVLVHGDYDVTVWTADEWWAGTDATPYFQVEGHRGRSGNIQVRGMSLKVGRSSRAKFSSSDFGVIYRVKIGHDNSGWWPGWKVHKVRFHDKKRGKDYEFYVNQWIENGNTATRTRKVQGGWGPWTRPHSSGSCSKTCGGGYVKTARGCNDPPPYFGGATCQGSPIRFDRCNTHQCPVDGRWSLWSTYTSCTSSCGGGTQTRTRECNSPAPARGGKTCTGSKSETRQCNTNDCAVDGGWSKWSVFGSCSATCGNGTESRRRSCDNPPPSGGGKNCEGKDTETQPCSIQPCPVAGAWSIWSNFTQCSVTCGGGLQSRSRSCDNPAPQYGGKGCEGDRTESRECNSQLCPVDGAWGQWSNFMPCSVSCGGGMQSQRRSCDNPPPKHGGKNCEGNTTQSRACNENPCPVDGKWSEWSNYTLCSVTCGGGLQSRGRSCDNPAPQHGGKDCEGNTTQSRACNEIPCPVDGKWSEWGNYTQCSVRCGGGLQSRGRSCDNPAPQHGGKDCEGDTTQSRACNEIPCPVDGVWSEWSNFTQCSVTCGGGIQSRARSCDHPTPQHGGKGCEGNTSQSRGCNDKPCPVDGGWGDWSNYTTCSVTCGGGTQMKTRKCSNPTPANGGEDCIGDRQQIRPCNNQTCADEPVCPSEKIPSKQKVNAGWTGITKEICLSRKDCWDPTCNNCPWCFKAPNMVTDDECPNPPLPASRRVNAGWFRMKPSDCFDDGNCWDSDCGSSCPHCYKKPSQVTGNEPNCYPPLVASKRTNAGRPGGTAEQCVKDGNCFDSSCGACIWCYKP